MSEEKKGEMSVSNTNEKVVKNEFKKQAKHFSNTGLTLNNKDYLHGY
ncbi:hypothetical protein [Chengkuizengella axinellae]|uniref:Uncharacterized protein n=1 Tax=Chengkuizengella axinellae TaxID=3064388 RepID=A0ABT9IU61_9BACL|nr:hypothetical protein [Chengkuizengella sp. 2205SS18-9]MDP5272884.1 hypothetical protein [Chengkuizengella sp. 2205SS18-9]